ncbi:uncharacterized protein M6B38_299270 [Iris pallida]|uniref:Uncharacterized protein n=1 Tax=Iris pallida TaxID=29817 RepID=A0AAX6HRL3_IRIPA|nr:uncharacterized protein M6B38_299270 [Iris pallida]
MRGVRPLSRYAEYMVSDPVIRAERFREGLALGYQDPDPFLLCDIAEVYAEARKVEREWGLKPKRDRDLFSGPVAAQRLLRALSFSISLSSIRPEHRFSRCSTLSRGRLSMGLLATLQETWSRLGGLPEEAGFVPLLRGGWTSVERLSCEPSQGSP